MDYSRYKGHTHGPWTHQNAHSIMAQGKSIATINSVDNPEETEVNARLMADAPVLLELYKTLESKCKGLEYMLLTKSLPCPSDKKI